MFDFPIFYSCMDNMSSDFDFLCQFISCNECVLFVSGPWNTKNTSIFGTENAKEIHHFEPHSKRRNSLVFCASKWWGRFILHYLWNSQKSRFWSNAGQLRPIKSSTNPADSCFQAECTSSLHSRRLLFSFEWNSWNIFRNFHNIDCLLLYKNQVAK